MVLIFFEGTAGKKRKPGKDAAQFKTDEETGKMVIDEGADEEEEAAGDNVEGAAYKESLTSVDGFTRGPNGRVKFNKDTKKRRREEAADEDVEMADPDAAPTTNKKPRGKKQEKPVGHEFKAKVSVPFHYHLLGVLTGYLESWRRCQKAWRGSVRVRLALAGSQKEGQDGHRWQEIVLHLVIACCDISRLFMCCIHTAI